MDTNDEWIRSRVGIASRRIAGPDETRGRHGVAAGGKALAASGLSPADIDLVIVATCTPEAPIPNTAATVATRLGIAAPGAYDLNAACAGFCYALATASDAVRAGRPGTCWSSGPRNCPSGWTGPTGPPASSSPTAPARRWSARPTDRRGAGIGPGGLG